jgi:hypothetical protein
MTREGILFRRLVRAIERIADTIAPAPSPGIAAPVGTPLSLVLNRAIETPERPPAADGDGILLNRS